MLTLFDQEVAERLHVASAVREARAGRARPGDSPRPLRGHHLPIRAYPKGHGQALRGGLGQARFSASLAEGGGPQGRREPAPSDGLYYININLK